MLYMERGGQVSEERRQEMAEFGLRRRGATKEEVEINLALLKDSKYDLFRDSGATQKSVLFSTAPSVNDIVTSLVLDKIGVTAESVVPALFSSRADSIAIGVGDLVQDIAKTINDNKALRYSLEVLDIVGAPVAYAARQAIEGTYIGSKLEEAQQYVFNKASGLFTDVGYDNLSAQSGGLGIFSVLSVGASGGAKGLLDDVARIQRGGAHATVRGVKGYESHHMSADSVSSIPTNQGPAIAMKVDDHRLTASWGSSKEARAYRQKQSELIQKGDFTAAQKMDIDDVKDKFGSKYDNAISQMLEYTKKEGF